MPELRIYYVTARKKGTVENFQPVSYKRLKENRTSIDSGFTSRTLEDFCSTKEEALKTMRLLNKKGYESHFFRYSPRSDGIDLDDLLNKNRNN